MARVRTVTPDGKRIRELRLELGLKPDELAAQIRRHPQTIRRLERGAIETASETLIAQVARALKAKSSDITRHDAVNGRDAA